MHDLLPSRRNLCEVNIGATDRSQELGVVTTVRQKEVSILQCLQSRTQIKAQELGDRHGDVSAVGIDGKEGGLEPLIANNDPSSLSNSSYSRAQSANFASTPAAAMYHKSATRQSMLVKPATCELQRLLPIARARQFTTQYPHQRLKNVSTSKALRSRGNVRRSCRYRR